MTVPAEFLRACGRVKDGNVEGVVMTIGAFLNEPEMLHESLLYAYENGVPVTFAPMPQPEA